MRSDKQKPELRQRVVDELRAAITARDDWLLVHLSVRRPGVVSYGSDTVFEGFANHRELRGPRWRPLSNARTYADLGYSWIVAGPITMALLARQLLQQNVPAGVVMHAHAVERWAPELAVPQPVVNSVRGFLSPDVPENRHLGTRRPGGRAKRKRLRKPCHFCGAASDLTLHHLIRREMGGTTEEPNLLSVCRPCHDKVNSGVLNDTDLVHKVYLERARRTLEALRRNQPSGYTEAG